MADANLFDPRGTIAFPRRVEVLGSVDGNQIFGLSHTGFSAPARIVPTTVRGLKGFTTHLARNLVFISPRKTSVLANTTATMVRQPDQASDCWRHPGQHRDAFEKSATAVECTFHAPIFDMSGS